MNEQDEQGQRRPMPVKGVRQYVLSRLRALGYVVVEVEPSLATGSGWLVEIRTSETAEFTDAYNSLEALMAFLRGAETAGVLALNT